MDEKLNPKLFGLPARTAVIQRSKNEISLVINRKSRIIMKDAYSILDKAQKITRYNSAISISLETTAPVCSKSTKFLNENRIGIVKVSSPHQ